MTRAGDLAGVVGPAKLDDADDDLAAPTLRAPWFKLDAMAWLSRPEIQRMNLAQQGAFARLLALSWGDGTQSPSLPNDNAALAQMLGLDLPTWNAEYRVTVLASWRVEGDRLVQPEYVDQWEEMVERAANRRAAGALGGRGKKRDEAHVARELTYNAEWETIRGLYPKRTGSQGWREAEVHYKARRREGATNREIRDGLDRYIAFCNATQRTGTELVMQARRFFGRGKEYLEPWDVTTNGKPRPPHNAADRQRESLREGL